MNESSTVTSTLGIVVKVCSRYWEHLPVSVQSWYGLDDMVNDCVCQVLRALPKYAADKARVSTFVGIVAINHCRQICEMHRVGKRAACTTIPIGEYEWGLVDSYTAFERYLIAKDGVERTLATASDPLRRILSCILDASTSVTRKANVPANVYVAPLAEELQCIAVKEHVTFDDFQLVLRYRYAT